MGRGEGAVKEFRDFIMRGNVVDLAVAVVIGAAFGAVIASFVGDLLTPLIAAIFGKQDFSTLTFTINGSTFKYGSFINALITFTMIALAVFFFVVNRSTTCASSRRAGKRRRLRRAPRFSCSRRSETSCEAVDREHATGHLLFVPEPHGYELLEREGEAPLVGTTIELDAGRGRFVVAKVAASPLPDDHAAAPISRASRSPAREAPYTGAGTRLGVGATWCRPERAGGSPMNYTLWGRATSPTFERFAEDLDAALRRAGYEPATNGADADLVLNLIDATRPEAVPAPIARDVRRGDPRVSRGSRRRAADELSASRPGPREHRPLLRAEQGGLVHDDGAWPLRRRRERR